MRKYLEKYLEVNFLKEDLRKLGLTFISGGIGGIFLQHLVSIELAYWLVSIGSGMWFYGLARIRGN